MLLIYDMSGVRDRLIVTNRFFGVLLSRRRQPDMQSEIYDELLDKMNVMGAGIESLLTVSDTLQKDGDDSFPPDMLFSIYHMCLSNIFEQTKDIIEKLDSMSMETE